MRTAMMRFGVEPERKLIWLRITLALALSCGFVLSWRLWVSTRLFPLSPVSDSSPTVPFPLDYIWFLLLLGLLLAVIITTQPRKLILILLSLAVLLSLWDQTRWQPWFYQYLFMLAALGFYAWKEPQIKNNQTALNSCRLIVVCTYFWSGLQKLNVNFFKETWPEISNSLPRLLQTSVKSLPFFLILIIPLLEISIGLGLLTRKYRNVAVIFAVATHVFILLLLISSGENTVVWPWNIAMVLFVLTLFWRDKETTPRKILIGKKPFHMLVFILFGVLPALSFMDLWDSYLSSTLYSGNTNQAVIYVSPAVIDRLPMVLHPYVWQSTEPFFLDINRWAYGELNVPVYPESRVYRTVTKQICKYAESSSDIKLRIKGKPNPFSGLRESEYYGCNSH
jgi:hypothetical protein